MLISILKKIFIKKDILNFDHNILIWNFNRDFKYGCYFILNLIQQVYHDLSIR